MEILTVKKIFKDFVLIFLLILSVRTQILSQELNLGVPEIINYKPSEYNGHPQVITGFQDKRGCLYFGGPFNLICFNGTTWNSIVSDVLSFNSFCQDNSNKIFVGNKGDFGYLYTNLFGNLFFRSLKNKLPDSNLGSDKYKVINVNNNIYFISKNKIYKYLNDNIEIYENKALTDNCLNLFNELIFSTDTNSYIFKNQTFLIMPDFENNPIDFYVPMDSTSFLYISNNKIYTYNLSNLREFYKNPYQKISDDKINGGEFDSELNLYLSQTTVKDFIQLNDSLYAIATQSLGVVIFNKKGKIKYSLSTENGLINDFVNSLYIDQNENLWCSTTNGISYVLLSNFTTSFVDNYGLPSTINSSIIFNRNLYITTRQGLYVAPPIEIIDNKLNTKLIQLTNKNFYCWELLLYKNKNADYLLFSVENEIYQIKKDSIELIVKTNGMVDGLHQLSINKNCILFFQNQVLTIYDLSNFKKPFEIKQKNNLILNGTTINIMEESLTSIWVTTLRNGIAHFKINSADFNDCSLNQYDEKNGLPQSYFMMVYKFDNKILIATDFGFYTPVFDTLSGNDTIYKFEKYNFWNNEEIDNLGFKTVEKLNDSTFFLYLDETYFGQVIRNNGKSNLDTLSYQHIDLNSTYKTKTEGDFIFLYGNNGNLQIQNSKFKKNYNLPYNILISKVTIARDSVIFNGTFFQNNDSTNFGIIQPKEFIPEIEYDYNSISFEYSAVYYEDKNNTYYRYYLEGQENEWSNWTLDIKKEYTNLKEGTYKFHVIAKNLYNQMSNEAIYEFYIKTPWYRSVLMEIIYIIISILLVLLIVKLNSRRLKVVNLKLETIVKERTLEIVQKNTSLEKQKEEIQAQAEELKTTNEELEKLSIAASETDNAIIIMDEFTNFKWINHGFTKLYGFSFDEFKYKFGNNLITSSSNSDISEIIENCRKTKKSFIYESQIPSKDGNLLWVQSTLTPIISENKINNFICIDSNISKLKDAQNEIIHQRNELARKNNNINASINYAQTIQNAILPVKEYMDSFFENFVLYRPKDIVSGDFYWFVQVDIESSKFLYLAVADCTGHGVPGAFISMIFNRLLNEAVNEKRIFETNRILEEVDKSFKIQLKQDLNLNNDGMDICLIKIKNEDLNSEKQSGYSDEFFNIDFCGAKRPVFHYKTSTSEVVQIKPDRRSIGGYSNQQCLINFTNKKIEVRKNDLIYLTTDGFTDQNNIKRKSFGTVAFIKLVNKIATLPLFQQKEIINSEIENWMYGADQRDDITILGLKF